MLLPYAYGNMRERKATNCLLSSAKKKKYCVCERGRTYFGPVLQIFKKRIRGQHNPATGRAEAQHVRVTREKALRVQWGEANPFFSPSAGTILGSSHPAEPKGALSGVKEGAGLPPRPVLDGQVSPPLPKRRFPAPECQEAEFRDALPDLLRGDGAWASPSGALRCVRVCSVRMFKAEKEEKTCAKLFPPPFAGEAARKAAAAACPFKVLRRCPSSGPVRRQPSGAAAKEKGLDSHRPGRSAS